MSPVQSLGLTLGVVGLFYGCVSPRSPSSAQSRAEALVEQGTRKAREGDYREAIAKYDEAIRLSPRHPAAHAQRGFARSAIGDSQGSHQDFQLVARLRVEELEGRIESLPSDTQAYLRRGLLRTELGDYQRAIEDYDHALSLGPSEAAYVHRGHARYRMGDTRGAIADYTAALGLNPNLAEIHVSRAVAYSKLGNPRAAAEDFERARSLRPNDQVR